MTPFIQELTKPEDIRGLEPMIIEYLRIVEAELRSVGVAVDPDEMAADMMAHLDRYVPPLGRAYVASAEDQLRGMAFLRPLEEGRIELKRLYVRPETRGTGLGRKLLLHTIDAARDLGATELVLDTIRQLKPAIALYQKEGFEFIDAYEGSEAAQFSEAAPYAIFMLKKI